jgi:hypothetical protein
MPRLGLGALVATVIALAGCGGDEPPRQDASRTTAAGESVRLAIDDPGRRGVPARRSGDRLTATAEIRGTAPPFSLLRLRSECARDACTITTDADDRGRWQGRVEVVASVDQPYARVMAELSGELAFVLVRLRPPRDDRRRKAEDRTHAEPAPKAERTPPSASEPGALPPPRSSSRTGSGGHVLVVGDSLEVMTSPYLQRYLPGVRLTVNAVGGYSSLQIFRLFQESYDPSQSVIVFDAGTNDNPAYPEILAGRLRAVASMVGDRCMVVPTIHGLTVNGIDSSGKNRVVRAFVASRPGTQMPDWEGFVKAHPELMQPDDLHPTAEGADHRARLIADAIWTCLALAGGDR